MFYPPRPITRARWDEIGLPSDLFDRWAAGVFSGARIIEGERGRQLLVTEPGSEFLLGGTCDEVETAKSRLYLNI